MHLTKGRVIVRGKLVSRGTAKFADYVLYARPNANIPLAIVEAKDNNHGVGDGMQQGLGYADMLDVPFVFSSNGDGFLLHDRTGHGAKVEQHLSLDQFPSPDELWRRYCAWKTLTPESESIVTQDYYSDSGGKAPRYYQVNAINRVIEAAAKGQKPHLARDGDWHGQDVHSVSDHLAPVEGGGEETHSVSRRPAISSSIRTKTNTSSPSPGR